MPQFEMPVAPYDPQWRGLSEFQKGYIECAFFTECHCDNPELEGAEFSDLAPQTLADMLEDCDLFMACLLDGKTVAEWIAAAIELDPGYSDGRAGHDFWLTRNGHGAGFWDRGLRSIGTQLTRLSKYFGSVGLYRGDDGKVWQC